MLNAIPDLDALDRNLEPPRKVDKRYGLESLGRRIDTLVELAKASPENEFLTGMKESLETQWERLSEKKAPENSKRLQINPASQYDSGYLAAAEWVEENYE